MLMPPPPIDIPVLDAIVALPVTVCVIPVIPGIPDMTIALVGVIVSCPEWSMIAT